ncbi:hypothetical protein ACLOJK_026817 [Asimina triloba]
MFLLFISPLPVCTLPPNPRRLAARCLVASSLAASPPRRLGIGIEGGMGAANWLAVGGAIFEWGFVVVRFDDDDALVGDDFVGGVEIVEVGVGVIDFGFVFCEEFDGLGLEGESEFLERFRDLGWF